MNRLIGLLLLVWSKSSTEVYSFSLNESYVELENDYFKDEFLLIASRIPDLPGLSTCDLQLLYISKNWNNLNIFPCKYINLDHYCSLTKKNISVIDSWGKLPSGLMKGNLYTIGNYDECLNLKTKLPAPFGTLEGQYCKGVLPIHNLGTARQAKTLAERVASNTQSRDGDELKIYLKSGVCIPRSCNPKELEKTLPFQLIQCKFNETIPMEPIDYVAM